MSARIWVLIGLIGFVALHGAPPRGIFPPTPEEGRTQPLFYPDGSDSDLPVSALKWAAEAPTVEVLPNGSDPDSQQAFLGFFMSTPEEAEQCGEEETEEVSTEDSCDSSGQDSGVRGVNVPGDRLAEEPKQYMEGYVQALLDTHYYAHHVIADVEDRKVFLKNLPENERIAAKIAQFVLDLPCVDEVEVVCEIECPEKEEARCCAGILGRETGIVFPNTVLFRPFLADLRQPNYSIARRWDDEVLGDRTLAVSVGETVPIMRWFGCWPCEGDIQLDFTAGVFAVWDIAATSSPLLTNDYLVGVPLSYASDCWSARLRYYFLTSHLGDEIVAKDPLAIPENINHHVVDLHFSWQVSEAFRYYIGTGYLFDVDSTRDSHPWIVEAGGEVSFINMANCCMGLESVPFLAMHLRWTEDQDWDLDGTYQLGLQWGAPNSLTRKMRAFVEVHDGFSAERHYSKMKHTYIAFRVAYGF